MTERDIIAKLVNAMQDAVEHGNVDHLDCAPDAGEFWHVALTAGEAYLNGLDVDAALKARESE